VSLVGAVFSLLGWLYPRSADQPAPTPAPRTADQPAPTVPPGITRN
jgi:hypothetical protein